MSPHVDVLLYVEDPGPAAYVAGLPRALEARDLRSRLLADGRAVGYLQTRNVDLETLTPGSNAARVLDAYSPALLVAGSAEDRDSLGLALIAEARSRGIATVGAVDAHANADHRFRGRTDDPLAYAPDWLMLPYRETKPAYVELAFPPERAVVCGKPECDQVRTERARLDSQDRDALRRAVFAGLTEGQQVVIFVAELSDGLNPAEFSRSPEYTLSGRGSSDGRTEVVMEEFLDVAKQAAPHVYKVLRLHPKQTGQDLAEYRPDFDLVSEGGSAWELAYAADLVVGMTSELLVHAALLGRPTLSIVPRGTEKNWLPLIGAGITPTATTRANVERHLRSLLENPVYPDEEALDGLVPPGATERAVELIEGLVRATVGAGS